MHLMLVVMVCTAVIGLKGNLGTTNTFGCIPKLRLKLSAWQIVLEILKISVNGSVDSGSAQEPHVIKVP